eukprot:8146540-Pyramimonas_sp.AAC.1
MPRGFRKGLRHSRTQCAMKSSLRLRRRCALHHIVEKVIRAPMCCCLRRSRIQEFVFGARGQAGGPTQRVAVHCRHGSMFRET